MLKSSGIYPGFGFSFTGPGFEIFVVEIRVAIPVRVEDFKI